MLNDIVTELVLSEIANLDENLLHDRPHLLICTPLQDSLDHSATVSLDAHVEYIFRDGVYNKLDIAGRHLLNALLDNVVAVLVEDAVHNVLFELSHQDLLLRQSYVLQGFLDHATPVHRFRQL